nr:hypothetical protein [Tanacetum cinerariifolium]
MEQEILRDIEETFQTLRKINMKLNPNKCTFGAKEGMFLGHLVNMKGIKACLKKAEAVIKLQSPRTLKEDMKQCIAELPMVTEPRPKEELIMYLYTNREAVSAVLLRKRDSQQMSVYFVSRALQTPKVNYSSMEKLVLALVHASSRLRRMLKWKFELEAFDITYRPRTSIHGQVLADFIAERPEEDGILVIANVPAIYMQEFWATAAVHHHSIRFKMNNKKHIVNLEYFKEMLRICLRILNQPFAELPFEEEILAFLRALGHSGEIKKITDGMYHKKNVDFTYLLWEDFVYQVEHKDAKKSNEIYYPRFTKVIVNFFMTKDPSIPMRNKYGAILPVELTNEAIRNSNAYKEYYAIASGAEPPKTKASVRKTQSSFDTTMPPPTAAYTRLSTSAKGKQPAKSSKAKGLSVLSEVALTEAEHMKLATKRILQQTCISQASGSGADERTSIIPGVLDVPTYESNKEISWKSSDEDDDDDVDEQSDDEFHDDQEDEDDQDDDDQDSDNDGNDDESHDMNVGGDEGPDAEDDDEELYGDLNINPEGRDIQMTDVHTTQFAKTVSSILDIVDRYIDHWMNEAVKVAVQLQSDRLRDEAQAKNEYFLNKLDENIQKIIKEQVKVQVKVQVSKILPKIKKTVNEQLEAEVLTRASNPSKTSYAMAADLSELELKKILIEKMDNNKSIHRSDEQMNLYKVLVDAYDCDKIILDTYGDTVTLKRRYDDEDKDEEPSAGSVMGSKIRRTGKEPESTSATKEKTSKTSSKSTEGIKSQKKAASKSAPAEEPMQTTQDLKKPAHLDFETCTDDDQPIEEASQHPKWFQKQMKPPTPDPFLKNQIKVDTLTPELLAGPMHNLFFLCMSTRSSTKNLFPPLDNPELTIRRRSHSDPTLLNNFEMAAEGNGDLPVPDLRTMEELCQPSLNGRGGPIAPIAIQATNFGLKNDMIQQV